MKELLKYLAKAEGTKIHFNDGEKDITAPFGIYKHDHPNAKIFSFIDDLAKQFNVELPSSSWTIATIDMMNMLIDSHEEKIEELAEDFYLEFAKGANLKYFPDKCIVSMFSMFTNSPLNAWKAVQDSINTLISNGFIMGEQLVVDGHAGGKTFEALHTAKRNIFDDRFGSYYFETLMLFNMSRRYASLVKKNPEKYLKYLNGWNNRLQYLTNI